MEREVLVRKKVTLKVIYILSLIVMVINFLIFVKYSFDGDYELKLKDEDIKNINEIQKEMLTKFPKANIVILNNARKLRTHLKFHTWQCIVYYKNGDVAEEDLRPAMIISYIEEKGRPAGLNNFYFSGVLLIVCAVSYFMKIKIEDKIELIDEKNSDSE